MDLSLRMDYYGCDFVEDGSFLVLKTDFMSLSPSTPPVDKSKDADEKNGDIELLNGVQGDEAPFSSINQSSTQQVLGEDPESSVDFNHSTSMQQGSAQGGSMMNSCPQDNGANSVTNTNMSMTSVSRRSTEGHLIESQELLHIVIAENRSLAKILAESNEKMKQLVTTTEKLTADHEEYKKKCETSREIISQLRTDNELLKSQVEMIQRQSNANDGNLKKEVASKQELLQKQSQTITELNQRLNTVLTHNDKLNEDLGASQKANQELRAQIEGLRSEKEIAMKQMGSMREEIDAGRKTVAKLNEHQLKIEKELANSKARVTSLEANVEKKTTSANLSTAEGATTSETVVRQPKKGLPCPIPRKRYF